MAKFKITIIAEGPDDPCGVLDQVEHCIPRAEWPDNITLCDEAETEGFAVTVEEWDGEPV